MFRSATTSCVLLVALVTTVCAQQKANPEGTGQPTGIKALYVGNEGVLLSHGGKSVLFDGLHREYGPEYLFPPAELLSAMETAKPPFDQVRVVLVSHIHLDHFHPQSVGLHLKNNPRARLISSAQTMAEIGKNYADQASIGPQTIEVTPEWKQRREVVVDGIKVSVLGMKHGSDRFWWVKNLGHIVELGGKKFFQFGDADMTDENFASFDLPKEKLDVAFVPYWYLLSDRGRKLVREKIGAKTVVAVHIPPATAQQEAEKLRGLFPGVISLTTIRQEVDL